MNLWSIWFSLSNIVWQVFTYVPQNWKTFLLLFALSVKLEILQKYEFDVMPVFTSFFGVYVTWLSKLIISASCHGIKAGLDMTAAVSLCFVFCVLIILDSFSFKPPPFPLPLSDVQEGKGSGAAMDVRSE